jgi:hypothetical protein
MLYGTIFHMKVKSGKEAEGIACFQDWEKDRQPNADGAIGGFVMRPDNTPNTLIGVAMFRDKASYVANGQTPEQNTWFNRLMECLEEPSVWEDGEYVMEDSKEL